MYAISRFFSRELHTSIIEGERKKERVIEKIGRAIYIYMVDRIYIERKKTGERQTEKEKRQRERESAFVRALR